MTTSALNGNDPVILPRPIDKFQPLSPPPAEESGFKRNFVGRQSLRESKRALFSREKLPPKHAFKLTGMRKGASLPDLRASTDDFTGPTFDRRWSTPDLKKSALNVASPTSGLSTPSPDVMKSAPGSIAPAQISQKIPLTEVQHAPPAVEIRPASPRIAVQTDIPETDLHTPQGQLRCDVAAKVLERIEDRLIQLMQGPVKPDVRSAVQRQRCAIRSLATELAARGGVATSESRAPSTCPGLTIADSNKLIHVLRETRRSVCAPPSRFSRVLGWVVRQLPQSWSQRLPASWKVDINTDRVALLDMLLQHFETQVLGGYAALVRETAEAFRARRYEGLSQAGTSRSTFLGATGTIPVMGDPLTVSAGVVVGATILGRDLAACEDGDIEQSKWWSGTFGVGVTAQLWGIVKAKLSVTDTETRKEGVFFSDVEHLVKSREGSVHNESISDGVSGSLKDVMGKSRFILGGRMKLSELDALQDKAYAQRDIFAKAVGPISMPVVDADNDLHMVGVNSRPIEMPSPSQFVSSKRETAVSGEVGALTGPVALGLKATGAQAMMELTIQSRQGFWQAIRNGGDDSDSMVSAAWQERVAALRKAGERIALPLAHLPNLRAEFSVEELLASVGEGAPPAAPTERMITKAIAAPTMTLPTADRVKPAFRIDTATASQLQALLKDLDQEFDNYCYARRQIEAGMPRHSGRVRAIEGRWRVQQSPKAMYAYVQRLHIVHALIGLRLRDLGHADEPLFHQFASKLDAPDMTSYRYAVAKPYITFSNETDMTEHTRSVELSGGLQVQLAISPGLTLKGSAQVRTRRDWNMLRDGNYVDVVIHPMFTLSTHFQFPEIGQLMERLAELGLHEKLLGPQIEKVAEYLKESLAPGIEGAYTPDRPLSKKLQRIRFCLYQPAEAKGLDKMRLQYVRYSSGHSGPVHNRELFSSQRLGTETLSYVFMRHHAFFLHPAVEKRKPNWDTYCASYPEELGAMMEGLGAPDSAIRAEAEHYWEQVLKCAADDSEKQRLAVMRQDFFAVMSRYAMTYSGGTGAVDPGVYEAARSELDTFAELHMAPWLQARARKIRRKAYFKLLD